MEQLLIVLLLVVFLQTRIMNLKNAAAIFEFIDMELCASDSKVKK